MMLTSGGSAFMAVMMYRITGLPGIIFATIYQQTKCLLVSYSDKPLGLF